MKGTVTSSNTSTISTPSSNRRISNWLLLLHIAFCQSHLEWALHPSTLCKHSDFLSLTNKLHTAVGLSHSPSCKCWNTSWSCSHLLPTVCWSNLTDYLISDNWKHVKYFGTWSQNWALPIHPVIPCIAVNALPCATFRSRCSLWKFLLFEF